MKKIVLKSILIASLFGAWSCGNSNQKDSAEVKTDSTAVQTTKTEPQYCNIDHYTPLDTAIQHTKNYACYLKNLNASNCGVKIDETKAFLVSKCDLLSVLGIPVATDSQFDYVRVYFGLTSANTPKLYLTPVVGADPAAGIAGRDTILVGPTGSGLPAQYVLDLNFPCPNLCDPRSPLNSVCDRLSANTPAKK